MRDKDIYDYRLNTPFTIDERIDQAAIALNSGTFQIHSPKIRRRDDKLMCFPAIWEDKLYLRHVNQKLELAYKVRTTNRSSIIKQICSLLKSDAPMRILRTDVKSFYRSISIESLITQISRDGFMRYEEMRAIETVLRASQNGAMKGLPWGLSISSTLAEIAMQEFDHSVWKIAGLFYYRRFVDDIIAVSPCSAYQLLSQFESILPKPLRLGAEKTKETEEIISKTQPHQTSFQYLGYAFERDLSIKKGKNIVETRVSIAPSKIERMITRIDLSIARYKEDGNLTVLRGRLKMLTGNYYIRKSGHPDPIPVGIFYNYKFIDDVKDLMVLDKHLRGKLVALRIFNRSRGAGQICIKSLFVLSFESGWKDRISHRFSRDRLNKYRSVWIYG